MSRKLSLSDFRAVRTVLEPDDFALGKDEPDPPPSDQISEKTWLGITVLPDDVAIRTSDHNGRMLGEAYWLWAQWIEAIGEPEDALFNPMLSTFNTRMRAAGYQSLWDTKDTKQQSLAGGYARRLYRDLCNYAHSRPGFTDGDLRESNGPIYVGKVLLNWYYAYLRTISLCSVSMLLARQSGPREKMRQLFIDDQNVLDPDVLEAYKLT